MTKPNTVTPSHTDPFSRKYKILSKIGEGSYSEVLKCKNRESGSIYACKRLKHCYRSWNQVNDIPEIVTLRKLARHPNILQMVEIHFDPSAGRVSLVFELMDMNLYELIKDRKRLLPESRVRVMMFQLMRALRHLHKHGIFHRDVKPENILLKNDLLKLGDLGSVRGLYSRPPYTEYISTRWYRSPECLLTCGYYSFKMDVWAAGCVFYEILTLRPLFPGSSELDQINRVHNVLGPPPQKILQKFQTHAGIERDYSRHSSKQARLDTIKKVLGELKNSNFDWYFTGKESKGVDTLLPTHVSPEAKDLLKHLLHYDPDSRPSSHRALQHAYFKDLREQAQRAARDKMPAVTGPIVTIVGDEGGLEVVADDNANPVDLSTLGDGKLKIKQLPRRSSDLKDLKELKETLSSKKSILHKESSSSNKLHVPAPPFKSLTPALKEAGEIFSREPNLEESVKIPHSTTKLELKRVEDRAKLVARTIANLHKFGGDSSISSLPFQKIYIGVDEEEGDGPNNHPTTLDQSPSPLSHETKTKTIPKSHNRNSQRQHHRINPGNPTSNSNSTPIRRRESSKITLDIERKTSMTLLSNDNSTTSTRGFPLDFIDKTALTPDALTRINENRRIAHMQPIGNLDLNPRRHSNANSNHSYSTSTTPAKDKDSHYINSPGPPELKQQQQQPLRLQRSPLPMSPNEFSPRTYQHQKNPQKLKPDHNYLSGSPSRGRQNDGLGLDSGSGTGSGHSNSKYPNTSSNSTNRQVKELLASLPIKRKVVQNGKVMDKGKIESNSIHKQGQGPGPGQAAAPDDRLSYKSLAEIKKIYSSNQLAKNLGALRKKYDAESKATNNLQNQSSTLGGKNEMTANTKTFNLDKKLPSFLNTIKGLDDKMQITNNKTLATTHTNEFPKVKQESKVHLRDSPYERESISGRRDRDHHTMHNSSRQQNTDNPNDTRKQLINIKDIGTAFSRRDDNMKRSSHANGTTKDISREAHNNSVVNQHDIHRIPDRLLRDRDRTDRERDIGNEQEKPLSERALRDRDHHDLDSRRYNINNNGTGIAGRKNKSLDPIQQIQQQSLDSVASLSPTNIRRVIENRRKAELLTTDTEADGDNSNLKYRKIDSSKRKRRSRYSTGSSNPNTSRTPQPNDRDPLVSSLSTNNTGTKIAQESTTRRQPVSILPENQSQASARISAFVAAATKYSTSSTTNKQVREILAEMRKRRDVLEERVIKDTNYHSWAKNPRVEDGNASPKIKSKLSESMLKRSTETDLPRRDEFGERDPYYHANNYKNSSKLQSSLTSRHIKNGQIQSHRSVQGASGKELSPATHTDSQHYSTRRSEDMDYKVKLGHQSSNYVKYLESESRIKGLGKKMDLSSNSHQSQTGAGSKIFPRNRYATNLHK